MIERESVPLTLRQENTREFCKRHNIIEQTYYYQASKEENQKAILELSLNIAKREVPEVLKVLLDNAKAGKEKSIEMYLDYVLKLAKNLDIKTDGKALSDGLTDKQKKALEAILYDQPKSIGESNKRKPGRKSLPVQ